MGIFRRSEPRRNSGKRKLGGSVLAAIERIGILDARAPDFERAPGTLARRGRGFTSRIRSEALFVSRFCYRQLEQDLLGLIFGFHRRSLNASTSGLGRDSSTPIVKKL